MAFYDRLISPRLYFATKYINHNKITKNWTAAQANCTHDCICALWRYFSVQKTTNLFKFAGASW